MIKTANLSDLERILPIHQQAFDESDGPLIMELVADLLKDPTAEPTLSLIAWEGSEAVGHILFTKASIQGHEAQVSLLAPLAVMPGMQGKGVGGRLIREGLKRLAGQQVDMVFVLGHTTYYPKFGFKPAGIHRYPAPYPIPAQHENAWMMLELNPGIESLVEGKLMCAKALDKPEHW